MKKIVYLFLIGIFLATGISSCNKYEEGPKISLRSKTKRLVGVWKLDNAVRNGTDITDQYHDDFSYEFKKDGDYTFTQNSNTTVGTWEFNDDKTEIILYNENDQFPEKFYILRLTDIEIILEKKIGDEVTIFYFSAVGE